MEALRAEDTLREKGGRRVLPMTVPMLMPNSPAAYVELELGARAGAHERATALTRVGLRLLLVADRQETLHGLRALLALECERWH